MMQGRMPAQIVNTFRRDSNNLSSSDNTEAIIPHNEGVCQPWSFGNRCGHVPFSPTITEFPKHHKRRFPVLEQAKANMLTAYHHSMRLPIGKMFYDSNKLNKDSSYRQRRSESREALTCRIGQVILHCVNLANMALGKILPSGVFSPYGLEYIAKLANTTKQRVKRALDIFIEFGYVTLLERKYMTANGLFRSEMPIITVHPSLFSDLEISSSDLAKHQKKQDDQATREQLAQKGKQAQQTKKASKKVAKKAMKQIKELLTLAQSGKSLTKEEKEYLDREMPGYKRVKAPAGRYRDFTGCSQNKDAHDYNSPIRAANFLGHISEYGDKLRIEDDDS